jgi:hypothetical protein
MLFWFIEQSLLQGDAENLKYILTDEKNKS